MSQPSTGTPMVARNSIPNITTPRSGNPSRQFHALRKMDRASAIKNLISGVCLLRSTTEREILERGSMAFIEMRLFEVAEYSLRSILLFSVSRGKASKMFSEHCKAALSAMRDVAEEVTGRETRYRKNLEDFARENQKRGRL